MDFFKIDEVLNQLAIKRPVFHSEADFQHALAWELHCSFPSGIVRLEFKPPELDERMYVDVWFKGQYMTYVVELKYKTRKIRLDIDTERFDLTDHSAQDHGSYDFLKDIQRLERIVHGTENRIGFAILLTNDRSYWQPPQRDTAASEFRLFQGRTIHSEMAWGPQAGVNTIKGREKPIKLIGEYKLEWQDYSHPSNNSYGQFRFLIVKVAR